MCVRVCVRVWERALFSFLNRSTAEKLFVSEKQTVHKEKRKSRFDPGNCFIKCTPCVISSVILQSSEQSVKQTKAPTTNIQVNKTLNILQSLSKWHNNPRILFLEYYCAHTAVFKACHCYLYSMFKDTLHIMLRYEENKELRAWSGLCTVLYQSVS